MNERGWYLMDMMERSPSLNREALMKIVAMAFRNSRNERDSELLGRIGHCTDGDMSGVLEVAVRKQNA